MYTEYIYSEYIHILNIYIEYTEYYNFTEYILNIIYKYINIYTHTHTEYYIVRTAVLMLGFFHLNDAFGICVCCAFGAFSLVYRLLLYG